MDSLSIVIPAYNEANRLPASLEAVLAYAEGRFPWSEVIVVDDGSTDNTAETVEALGDARVRLLRNPGNRGKGYAVRHGMLAATGDWRLFTDADLSAPIEELGRLFAEAKRTGAAVAIGSRAIDRRLISVRQSWIRETAGRIFNLAMRVMTGLSFQDTQCGFKLFTADAAQRIFKRQLLNGFGFDVEDLYIAKKLGIKVVEVPVRWAHAEGTKVGLASGLQAFFDPLRIRWNNLKGLYNSEIG